MELQEIEVEIGKDGQVRVHVRGVKGDACLSLTQSLEEALGADIILREMTPELLENPVAVEQKVRVKGQKRQ